MPKTKKTVVKPVSKSAKPKLSPAERSQIAKDRWAKRKKAEAPQIAGIATNVYYAPPETNAVLQGFVADTPQSEPAPQPPTPAQPTSPPPVAPDQPPYPQNPTPEQPPALPESHSVSPVESSPDKMSGEPVKWSEFQRKISPQEREAIRQEFIAELERNTPPVAAQLTPVAPKKAKKYVGPKEFSVALRAAEGRLAKAINERAEAMGKLAGLNAEIPSLMGIIQALKGSQNNTVSIAPIAFDFQSPVPQPFQAPHNPLAGIQEAMAAPPFSRAQGGAIQFSPEVVGTLEGPDDDDEDKFITGPYAGGGFIGG